MQSYHFNLTTNNKALVVFIERKPEPPFAKAHFTASSKWQIFMQFIKIIVKKLIDEKKEEKTHTPTFSLVTFNGFSIWQRLTIKYIGLI